MRLQETTRWLWLSPYGELMNTVDVARIYRGEHPGVQHIPTVVHVDPRRGRNPVQGFFYDPSFHSRITLTPEVIERWRSMSIEHRSCAVNTVAHEIAHTFSSSPTRGRWVIEDGGRRWIPPFLYGPLASYTIGSVAQCTMLLAHQPGYDSMPECLAEWGTRGFNSNHCV